MLKKLQACNVLLYSFISGFLLSIYSLIAVIYRKKRFFVFLCLIVLIVTLYKKVNYNPDVYYKLRNLVFNSIIEMYRYELSRGRNFMREHPIVFVLFLWISVNFVILNINYPENIFIYFCYFFCVLYKSLFLYPIHTYIFVVTINNQIRKYLKTQPILPSKNHVLFQDQDYRNNLRLMCAFEDWIEFIERIKLPENALIIISCCSIIILIYWYTFYWYFYSENIKLWFQLIKPFIFLIIKIAKFIVVLLSHLFLLLVIFIFFYILKNMVKNLKN